MEKAFQCGDMLMFPDDDNVYIFHNAETSGDETLATMTVKGQGRLVRFPLEEVRERAEVVGSLFVLGEDGFIPFK